MTFSVAGLASILPGDPDIALDPGAASMPLLQGTNFAENQPTDYYNPFPDTITALTFDLTMNASLTCSNGVRSLDCGAAGSFHCQSGYFLTCGFTYNSGNGNLAINFSGTNPSDGDPTDPELNEMEGIPPLLPGCLPTPGNPNQQDTPGCKAVGHFIIDLKGWSNAESPQLFSGTPTFDVADVAVSPEPASEVLIGSVLLIGAGFAGIRLRRRPVR
ncbi:MAG: hypothetical protein P4L56_07870 [Candidatus Sulfopaludibacter sp.]|nr:hypothetical protein [Candidatus Sulfopaludibacter sp.]